MIANQTLDLLGALPPAQQALGANFAAPKADPLAARFDAALLDAAKLLRDNSRGSEGPLPVPKIEAALEAALAELNQRPLEQLQALAQRPQVLKQASDALSQAFSLEPRESALLETALQRGLEGLTNYAAKPTAVESLNRSETLGLDPELGQDQPYTAAALSQGVLVPVIVSTRTDGGGGPETVNSLSKSAPQAENKAPQAQVVQVTVSSQATAQPAATPAAPAQNAATVAQAPVKAQGQVQAQVPAAPKGQSAASQPAAASPKAAEALGLELKSAKTPVLLKADSLVTLKEDGTWVIPEQKGTAQAPVQPQAPQAAAQPQTAVVPVASLKLEQQPQDSEGTEATLQRRETAELPKRVFETASQPALQALNAESLGGLNNLARHTLRQEALRESVFAQVGEALQDAAAQDQGRLVIKLKPGQLGEVIVDLSLVDGKLSARLIASDSEVRDAFVRDLGGFKSSLEASGITVRELSVAVKAETQQDPGQGRQQGFDWRRTLDELSSSGEAPSPLSIPAAAPYFSAALGEPLRFSALA